MNPEVPATTTQPIPVSPPIPTAPTPKTNWPVSILFLILGILIGVGGLWGYQNYLPLLINKPVEIATPSPIATATTDPTANWKTYADPKGTYSFKYPDDWKLTLNQIGGGQVILLDKIDTTQPKVGLPDGSLKDASYEINFSFPANNVVIPSNAEKYIISGITGSKYSEGCGGCSGAETFVVVTNNSQTDSFSYGAQASADTHTKYMTAFDQILSTFKFLPQAKTISGWNIYTDSAHGYLIQYPPMWTTKKVCHGGIVGDDYICFESPDFQESPVPVVEKGLLIVVATPGSSYFVASSNSSTDFCKEDTMFKLKSCEKIVVNGQQMIKKVYATFSFIDVAVLDQNSVIKLTIRLEYPFPSGYTGTTFDQMLSTFKFQ